MGIQYIYIEYGQLELVSVVNSTREPGEPFPAASSPNVAGAGYL